MSPDPDPVTFGISAIIGIAISIYVAAELLPGAFTALATAEYTSVDPAVQGLLKGLLPLISVVVIVMLFLRYGHLTG
jgi:hypothetical protein